MARGGDLQNLEQFLRDEAARRPAPEPEETAIAPADPGAYLSPRRRRLRVPGNELKLLRDGVEAFPEMLDAIRAARRRIRVEVYMFIDDAVGELFGRALVEAAARGVQVNVLYDWLGSIEARRSFFDRLRREGVDVRPFKPLSIARGIGAMIRRNHRKILVVDGEIAFVGGINIAAHWAPRGHGGGWRDDVIRVEGPVAMTLERLFSASWRMEAHKRLHRLRRRRPGFRSLPARRRGDVNAVVLSSRRAIHRAYLRAIHNARRSVMIANAYFLPDRRLLRALRRTARKGIRVKLVLAGKSDHPIVTWAGRALYDRMLRWGVEIFEWYDGVLHSKTAVVDGTWGTVGSFNLEPMSLRFNYEANLVFTDPRWGAALERSFLDDCQKCRRIDPGEWARRPWWHRLVERAAYLLRRLL